MIKPCPFCGSEARVCWGGDGTGGTLTFVECYRCEARGETVYTNNLNEPPEKIKNQAIALWNTRTDYCTGGEEKK